MTPQLIFILTLTILLIFAAIVVVRSAYSLKHRDVKKDRYFCPSCRRYWYEDALEQGSQDLACPVCFCEDLRKIGK